MFPIIAALSQVGGILVDKITLTRKQVELRVFIPLLFLFLVLTTGILYPFLGKVNTDFLKPSFLLLFLAMMICAVIWNIFYYRGVQQEKIHDYELIIMFQPLLTILLATLFLKGERNIHIIIASLLAAIFLIIAHIKRKHLDLTLGAWNLIGAVVFMSVELIIIDQLLKVYSPVALYFLRTGILFIFFYIYYRPKVNKVANANLWLIFATAALGTIQMVTKFYGFEVYGVVYTSLVLILSPVLVYVLSNIFLHERFKARTIISFVVILLCIVYATVLGK
jgi:drug/metabolite transporter (DMT)-like permease